MVKQAQMLPSELLKLILIAVFIVFILILIGVYWKEDLVNLIRKVIGLV